MSMATELTPVEYLTIGHVTEDQTPEGVVLGGTVTYAGLTANAFGKRVGVLTAAAGTTDLGSLAKLQVYRLSSESSSSFVNQYLEHGREQILQTRAHDIHSNDLPEVWSDAEIFHCGPVANEVDPAFCTHFEDKRIYLTPQGWLREWDHTGRITLKSWETLQPILPPKAVVVLSIEDLGGSLTPARSLARHCDILAVTLGADGVTIYHRKQISHYEAPRITELDPTGCGDIFAASFFVSLQMGMVISDAAKLANELSAAAATRAGLASVPTSIEVQQALAKFAS